MAIPIARIYAAFGEKDQAFRWLQQGYDERDPAVDWLNVDPSLDNLHTDPRFDLMLQKMRLPP